MGNVYSCAVIWLLITFFLLYYLHFFLATSIGWSCWRIRWGEFVWSNNVLFIWGTYHLSELTGRISQFANGTRRLWGTESCFWPKWPYSGRMAFRVIISSLRSAELKPLIGELAGPTGQIWPILSALKLLSPWMFWPLRKWNWVIEFNKIKILELDLELYWFQTGNQSLASVPCLG